MLNIRVAVLDSNYRSSYVLGKKCNGIRRVFLCPLAHSCKNTMIMKPELITLITANIHRSVYPTALFSVVTCMKYIILLFFTKKTNKEMPQTCVFVDEYYLYKRAQTYFRIKIVLCPEAATLFGCPTR